MITCVIFTTEVNKKLLKVNFDLYYCDIDSEEESRIVKITINKRNIFSLFLIIWFLKPGYFDTIGAIDLLYNIGRLFSLSYIFFYYIFFGKIPVESIILGLFYFCQIFSTFINEGDIARCIRVAVLNWGAFVVFFNVFKRDSKSIYTIILPVIRIIIYINLLTIILFPNGMYTTTLSTGWESEMNWFLGLRNGQTPWLICAFFLEWSNYMENKKERNGKIFLVVTTVVLILTAWRINMAQIQYAYNNSTAGGTLFAIGICFIFWIIPKRIMTSGIINIKSVFLANFLVFIMLVIFRIQDMFSYFIEIILKKDLTLTNRTIIWDNAISYLQGNWIIGVGYKESRQMANILGFNAAISTTHNSFLDILFFGGVLSLILIIIFIFYINVKEKKKDTSQAYIALVYSIGAILLIGQFEGSGFGICFIICTAAICSYKSNNNKIERRRYYVE